MILHAICRAIADRLSRTSLCRSSKLWCCRRVQNEGGAERSIAIGELAQTHAGLRIVAPQMLSAVERSLARSGQLSALNAYVARPGALEIIDGFKRLRAAQNMGWAELRVRELDLDARQAKAAIRVLNQAHGLHELEEAWLVRALYRDDRLS